MILKLQLEFSLILSKTGGISINAMNMKKGWAFVKSSAKGPQNISQ